MAAGDLLTADFQIEWRGLVMGHNTAYGWKSLDGWLAMPGMRLNDEARPGRHGAFAGQELADERVVTFDFTLMPWGATTMDAAFAALRLATAVEENPAEEALVVQLSGQKWQAFARVTRRALLADGLYTAQSTPGALQWVATDARLYAAGAALTATAGLPTAGGGGLVFPLVFPLVFGSGTSIADLVATNTGTVTTWPVFTITGPVTGPVVTNTTTSQALVFNPSFVVAAGQTLTIDTDARTVTLAGVNRRDQLVTAQWFGLPPAVATHLRFTSAGSYDPAAILTATWRPATI
jgi:hypothetical protein